MKSTRTHTTSVVVKFVCKSREMILQEAEKSFSSTESLLEWVGKRAVAETVKGHEVYLKPGLLRWTSGGQTHSYSWSTGSGKTHEFVKQPIPKKPSVETETCERCKGQGIYSWAEGRSGKCFRCKGSGRVEMIEKKDELPPIAEFQDDTLLTDWEIHQAMRDEEDENNPFVD